MDLGLKHKRALVTGSTAGIGYAAAEQLAREGATVIVNGRTKARVEAALAQLRAALPGGDVQGIAADLSTGASTLEIATADVDDAVVGRFLSNTRKHLNVAAEQAYDAFGASWCCESGPAHQPALFGRARSLCQPQHERAPFWRTLAPSARPLSGGGSPSAR